MLTSRFSVLCPSPRCVRLVCLNFKIGVIAHVQAYVQQEEIETPLGVADRASRLIEGQKILTSWKEKSSLIGQ